MSARAVAVAMVLGVFAARPLVGQAPSHLYDKFQVSVSAAGVILGTTVRLDSDEGEGTEVDSEDDLGLERVALRPRIGFRWRPGRRHEIEASYLFISRSGLKTLEQDVTIDSVTYAAGAALESKIGQSQLGVNYRWAIHAAERSQIGLNVGLGATFFDADWLGSASISNGSGTVADSVAFEQSLVGPSLAIGAFGRWQVGARWYVEAELGGLYVPIDNIKASIVQGGAAVRYFPLDWLGTELGYSLSSTRVKIDQKEDPLIDLGASGKIKYNNQNVRLGLVATF
ncbi:MAG TPA: hypothetical protein VFY20_03810 [Gemmatimonadales bacterium]|nr:hypothetical protein [Gemmatimonadales bacterium]